MVSKKLLRKLLQNLDDETLGDVLDTFDQKGTQSNHDHQSLPNKACVDVADFGSMSGMMENKYGAAFHAEYDEFGLFSAAYGPQLMMCPNREELFIINPKVPETFFKNLVYLLKETGLFKAHKTERYNYVLMQPDPHFAIKLRMCLALSCNFDHTWGKHDEVVLWCNTHKRRFYKGEKVPNVPILTRFNDIWDCYAKGLFHPIFENISSWHMKFVVNHEWTKEDMEYVRNVVLPNPDYSTWPYKAIKYNQKNYAGVDIHKCGDAPKYFYDEKRTTLELLYNPKYGGVCGALSGSIRACCQARGLPAQTTGQPWHCAVMWLKPTDSTGKNWKWMPGNSFPDKYLARTTFSWGEWSKMTINASWPLLVMDETFKKKDYFFFASTFKTKFDDLMAQHDENGPDPNRAKVQEAVGHLMTAISYAPCYLLYWIALAKVKDVEPEWILKDVEDLSESEALSKAFKEQTKDLDTEGQGYSHYLDLELAFLEDQYFAEDYQ